jgi:D-alanyl-D-alanine carboxypeptidase
VVFFRFDSNGERSYRFSTHSIDNMENHMRTNLTRIISGRTARAVTLVASAALLSVAASPDRPALRAVITGLPVAGFTGTMAARLLEGYGAPGRGLVRAKTGTLTGVTGLSGLIQDRDGTLLAFAALADRVHPIDTLGARAALDRIVAALATCGC